jgi:hypothetical protein
MKLLNALLLFALLMTYGCAFYSPHQATDNPVGDKRGRACSMYILGFHIKGENHIFNAARAAQISKISSVDRQLVGLPPIFWKSCTFVGGN